MSSDSTTLKKRKKDESEVNDQNERNHSKRGKLFNYDSESMIDAMSAVERGMTCRKASRIFGVPYSTLNQKTKFIASNNKKSGYQTVFSISQEQEFVIWILHMKKMGFLVTKKHFLDSIEMIVKKDNKVTPFVNNRPSISWLNHFCKRHPEVSLRQNEVPRIKTAAITELELKEWFKSKCEYFISKKLLNIDSSRIFNCEESGFLMNPERQRILVHHKKKELFNLTTIDTKVCLTTFFIINANGQLAPPMVMYPNEKVPSDTKDKTLKNWTTGTSESGWMTAENCFDYISNIFFKWCKENNIKFPIILYMDGYSPYLSYPLSKFCSENEIELIPLHPKAIHILQPMDKTVFKSLQAAWMAEVSDYHSNGRNVNKENFALILEKSIGKLDLKQIASKGFAECGLFPFTATAIKYFETQGQNNVSESETVCKETSFTNSNEDSALELEKDSNINKNNKESIKTKTNKKYVNNESKNEISNDANKQGYLRVKNLVKENIDKGMLNYDKGCNKNVEPNNIYKQDSLIAKKLIERSIDYKTLNNFKKSCEKNCYYGDIKNKGLYDFWLKCKNCIESTEDNPKNDEISILPSSPANEIQFIDLS